MGLIEHFGDWCDWWEKRHKRHTCVGAARAPAGWRDSVGLFAGFLAIW